MKVINFNDIEPVKFLGGNSYRAVLKSDNVGFALMKTIVDIGGAYRWHYKNHQEVCTCLSGHGFIKDLTDGSMHEIKEGDTYILDKHQPHEFTAMTKVVLISVFNPPLRGDETHDENGNYI